MDRINFITFQEKDQILPDFDFLNAFHFQTSTMQLLNSFLSRKTAMHTTTEQRNRDFTQHLSKNNY